MIVNPETGQPIAVSEPGSLTGAMGADIATGYGYTQDAYPTLFGMLEHIPGISQTAGWNAWRGANTITRGGFAPNRDFRNNWGGRIGNHNPLRPRSWSRLSSVDAMTSLGDGSANPYTPFNFMARIGNWAVGRSVGAGLARAAQGEELAGMAKWAQSRDLIPDGFRGDIKAGQHKGAFFSPGTYSRLSAAVRLGRQPIFGGEARMARRSINASQFLLRTDPGLADAWARTGRAATPREMGALVGTSARGAFSQYIGGYATEVLGQQTQFTRMAVSQAGKRGAISGMNTAFTHLKGIGLRAEGGALYHGGKKVGGFAASKIALQAGKAGIGSGAVAKGLGALGVRAGLLAVPGVNAVMAAWMAYDIAQMGVAGLKGLGTLTKDAVRSFKGSIDKPIMGMGFKDNSVAATSRSRGVMAIQNSRLNARSVLGNEGAMAHAHFG
jgi:hypothetical protein